MPLHRGHNRSRSPQRAEGPSLCDYELVADVLVGMGVVLQLAGIGVAASGLAALARQLNQRLPHHGPIEWIKRAFRIGPADREIEVHDAVMAVDAHGEVRVQGTRGRPADDSPLVDWNLYWESRVRNVEELLHCLRQDSQEASRRNAEQIATETEQRMAADVRLETLLRNLLGGEDGNALRRTWTGLAVTFGGLSLQLLAVPIG